MVDNTMSKEISRESKKNMNQIAQTLYLTTDFSIIISPVRYAKFESIRYFIDIDILQNRLIDIDIDIDIFGIALSISISILIFFRIALSISISISISIFFKSVDISTIDISYRYFNKEKE